MNLVYISIWAVIALTGLALLAIVGFFIREIIQGKVSPLTILVVIVPVALLVVLGFVLGSWAEAAIWTSLAMLALGALGLLLSGTRSLFSFGS